MIGVIMLLLGLGCTGAEPAHSEPALSSHEWRLVWRDEFEGEALDVDRWAPEESCWGGGNEERQCYTSRTENVRLENGRLVLAARREDWTGPLQPPERRGGTNEKKTQRYTSGKVRTRDLAAWTFGRFEARMKLPRGQGTWPAFWMLPQQDRYGSWAASGEIDIVEAVNLGEPCDHCGAAESENRILNALHYGGEWPDNVHTANYSTLPSELPHDGFHVFGVDWSAEEIVWRVDGAPVFSMKNQEWRSAGGDSDAAPFDQPFYLNLNLAVGGRLAEKRNGGGVDPSDFPAELVVDWVRVYQQTMK
jgi:beta-glucanase (GH16 family)